MRPWPRDHKESALVSFHPGAPQTTPLAQRHLPSQAARPGVPGAPQERVPRASTGPSEHTPSAFRERFT